MLLNAHNVSALGHTIHLHRQAATFWGIMDAAVVNAIQLEVVTWYRLQWWTGPLLANAHLAHSTVLLAPVTRFASHVPPTTFHTQPFPTTVYHAMDVGEVVV